MSKQSGVILRAPELAELPEISALCLRSKGHWGYSAEFLDACRDELTLTANDLDTSAICIAERDHAIIGIAQVETDTETAELTKLFIEPGVIGRGLGRVLFEWTTQTAKDAGAKTMTVTADPFAARFYEKLGFRAIGEEPSGSIAGRTLRIYAKAL